MDRRKFLARCAALAAAPLALPLLWRSGEAAVAASPRKQEPIEPLEKSEAEWRRLLTPEQFAVLRGEGTERAGSSPLNREEREGTFVCAGCFLPLFRSADKFESGTGWPSFTRPIAGRVGTKRDFKLIWPRTEYHCIRCGGHQGHVFDDGPEPTGQRWCNNGVALRFVPAGTELPALRS